MFSGAVLFVLVILFFLVIYAILGKLGLFKKIEKASDDMKKVFKDDKKGDDA